MDRRSFLKASFAVSVAASMPQFLSRPAAANPASTSPGQPTLLRVVKRTIEVNGRAATVFGLQQKDGSHGIRMRAGERFNVLLANETAEPTIVHWHGLTPPWPSDGVAGSPMPLLDAGAERSFDFPVALPGTNWMHAHTLQEQQLLAAPLIVADPRDDGRDEQEVVVLLHDFSFTPAEEILEKLKGGGHGDQSQATGGMQMDGMQMPGHGGGGAMDLNDIEYDAYLANDRTLDDPEVITVEKGGRVRLRLINGATATAFTLDLGELEGTLVSVDGQPVEPVTGRRFPVSMGQRVDVKLALPAEKRAFPVLALREGAVQRTGFILRVGDAPIAKLPLAGDQSGPILDLDLEGRLRAVAPLAEREPDRRFDLILGGSMTPYEWTLAASPAIMAAAGERVEITMMNKSMMAHPMHLHGHHFQVVAIDGVRFPGAIRDTVLLPPDRSVTIAVDADNPGQWAFHCHHLYHMAAGMMTTFAYAA